MLGWAQCRATKTAKVCSRWHLRTARGKHWLVQLGEGWEGHLIASTLGLRGIPEKGEPYSFLECKEKSRRSMLQTRLGRKAKKNNSEQLSLRYSQPLWTRSWTAWCNFKVGPVLVRQGSTENLSARLLLIIISVLWKKTTLGKGWLLMLVLLFFCYGNFLSCLSVTQRTSGIENL